VDTQYEEVLTGEDILDIQEVVRRVPISEHVLRYVLRLVRSTRVTTDEALDSVRDRVAWGAGPRASQFLVLGGKARALLHGRHHVSTEDIRAIAHPVLRHRIITTYGAEAEGWNTDRLIDDLLERTPIGESETLRDEQLPTVS
jgi:MoxR-like ATPase